MPPARGLAQSRRRQRSSGHRRARGARPHRLRHARRAGRDRARYAGKTVAVLGAGHSAIGTLIDLARLKDEAPATKSSGFCAATSPRRPLAAAPTTSSPRAVSSARCSRGLVRRGHVARRDWLPRAAIEREDGAGFASRGSACCGRHVVVDELVVATGFRPDLRSCASCASPRPRARMPAGSGAADRSERAQLRHGAAAWCARAGAARARLLCRRHEVLWPGADFLMITGYEQVRSIVADIAGDREAAQRVELVLPETGVCSGPVRQRPSRTVAADRPSRERHRVLRGRRSGQSERRDRLRLRLVEVVGWRRCRASADQAATPWVCSQDSSTAICQSLEWPLGVRLPSGSASSRST